MEDVAAPTPFTVGIMRTDNADYADLQKFSSAGYPGVFCWSHNQSRIALDVVENTTTLRLSVLDIQTSSVRDLARSVGTLTSQCWSVDDTQIVFEVGGNVVVQGLADSEPRTLAVGKAPTWSPDGGRIAFLDERDRNYYAIQPSGEGKKKLFHERHGMAGLYWSPDGQFVAYVVEKAGFLMDAETYELRVRRLKDGAEDTVVKDDVGCCESIQWVKNKELIARFQSESHTD